MGTLEQKMVDLESQVTDLRNELTRALETINSFERENKQLRQRVQQLEKKLEEKNNEKREPPAFVKPNRRKGRRRKRRGSPEGHPGKARPVPNKVVVTRHWTTWHWCPACKDKVQTPLPDAFPKERFGINLMVLVSYHRVLGLTVGKIRALLKEQYGLDICDATVLRMERRVAEEMGEHYSELVEAVREGRAVPIDETGWRVDGRNHWLWTCATREATIFHVDPRRNGKVAKRLLGKRRDSRVVVSDFYPAYNCLTDPMERCLEHMKREYKKVEAKKKRTTEQYKRFRRRVLRLLRDAFRIHENIKDEETRERRVARLRERLRAIYEENYTDPDRHHLAKRLRRHKDEMFTFLEVEGVDWHNNEAERALRPMLVARKNSYGCRILEGAVVGKDARLGPGCFVGPDCGVGTGAELGPGVALLDRTRLPGKAMPATVGAGAKVGGGAVVAGVKVGEGAYVAAGEVVEDDVPDGAVWMGGRVSARFEGKTWD